MASRGDIDAARVACEQVWEIRQHDTVPAAERAETAFGLAALLWRRPSERPRALQLADLAEAAVRRAGPQAERLRRQIHLWLEQR